MAAKRNRIINLHQIGGGRGLDEETRRDIFVRETGKRSQSDMTPVEIDRCAAALRKASTAPADKWKNRWREPSTKPHVRKVYALWWRLAEAGAVSRGGGAWHQSLNAFIGGKTFVAKWGEQETDAYFLSVERANDVIEALKAIAKRAGVELDR